MVHRTSAIEELSQAAAKIPWQVGVGIAPMAYLVFHVIADDHLDLASNSSSLVAPHADVLLIKALAWLFQYVVPAACLTGALTSFLKRAQSMSRGVTAKERSALPRDSMTAAQIELLLVSVFRQRGYRVSEQKSDAAALGADIVLTRRGETFLVHCRHWRASLVTVNLVRQLHRVVSSQGAHGGIFVTAGHFTQDASEFAESHQLELIDGDALHLLLAAAVTLDVPRSGKVAV